MALTDFQKFYFTDSTNICQKQVTFLADFLFQEINHFLSVSAYDALPLTRLEGLKDLRRQLEQHKDQMMDLMRASQGTHFNDLGYFYLFLFERISYNSCSWFNCHRFSSDPNHFSSSYKRLSKLYPFLELLPFYPSFGPVPECPCLFCHLKKC